MNILIAQDGSQYNNFGLTGWSEAINYFGHRRLLFVISTLLVIPTKIWTQVTYDATFEEAAESLIDYELCRPDSEKCIEPLTESERSLVHCYLRSAVKELRPYMPEDGSVELCNYVMSPDQKTMYLVIRYYPENEYPGKVVSQPALWNGSPIN